MATLYLHIGMPKTGTTAIQHFCYDNRDALCRNGYIFPVLEHQSETQLYHNACFMVQYLNANMRKDSPEWTKYQQYMNEIKELLNEYPNVLLSDETIWERTQAHETFWGELKREADARAIDIKIIVYLRRQDQYFSSFYSQKTRYPYLGPDRLPWEEGCLPWSQALSQEEASGRFNYFFYLERIASAFGRENIIVHIYDRKHFPHGDIIEDFLDALGLRMGDEYLKPDKYTNTSLSPNMTEIKRIINSLPGVTEKRDRLLWEAATVCSTLPDEQRQWSMFSQEELDELMALCEPSNRRIAQEYFGSAEPLFSPPGQLPPQWTPDNPDMYASIVRYFGAVVFEQQREIEKLREDATSKFFLRKKLRTLAHRIERKFRKLLKK